ncbi:hypothetical protein ABD91_01820 [Lysinibacillus sphaericus]|uniref:hypothetical protein n=1 Tax=Lysinibacillus sphaericus TaxID=1421 RepID=UPI0018CE2C00|nr:hypothetical protein [Lysinibacillus sphaericus]MBG9689665.1 hypothetical protein [Lysinibacillus sphaericus]
MNQVQKAEVKDTTSQISTHWKLSKFVDEVNRVFFQLYNVPLNVTINTINNYFRHLEERGIHEVERLNDVKVYNEIDLKIAIFIAAKRSKDLQEDIWSLPQIYEAIADSHDLETRKPLTSSSQKQDELFKRQLSEFKKEINEQLNRHGKFHQKVLEMQSSYDKKLENIMLDYTKMQKQLREEGREEWNKLPKSKRFTGLIFKQENINERERFIEDYVEKGLNERMLKTLHQGNQEDSSNDID